MMSTADQPAEWQPGDELYSRAAHPYSLYIFNFRDDPTSVTCAPCSDAASWPNPGPGRSLPDDPIADFLTAVRSTDG